MPFETIIKVCAMRLLVLAVTILLTSCGVEDEPTTSVTIGGVDSAEWWSEEYPPRSDNVKQAVIEVASKTYHTGIRVFSLLVEKQEILWLMLECAINTRKVKRCNNI